ncbi:hypothetical protein BAUCODRAFT_76280 [Baudoinia panamericana UAMH 10762]|uniref:Amino-acid acetyltransferase, mitochondrial n=1 Tax=Baudoinia panamericana (strain UAMH 10762) TaxID=717646 RepID=M2N3Q5_BAUPA|nr:uncharacterized protein BAUCODRAFT_76280 [Baudoinia panamericana UAMH 10762]EMC93355.1 hypothetical protein BAUCODRAFT_76280 [Baudoinia panamericana UAMH 10762]
MDVLSANATKRDAKQYLSRFKRVKTPHTGKTEGANSSVEEPSILRRQQASLDRLGVNLGGLYAPARAIAETPVFERSEKLRQNTVPNQQALHVAIVCLRAPQTLSDPVLDGVATTLSQLVKLDTRIVLVLELGSEGTYMGAREQRKTLAAQAERLLAAIKKHSREASRFVTGALETTEKGSTKLVLPQLIMEPLKRGVIPIVPGLAHTPSGQLTKVDVADVMAALTEGIAGGKGAGHTEGRQADTEASIDRIILLDAAGGVPSKVRSDNAHVFINLEQEYNDIQKELADYETWADGISSPNMYDQHKANLRMLKRCLAMLPSASSALIISPHEAAASSQATDAAEAAIGAGTRRQKNTLIHNLLTNKPMVSSSLPTARLTTTAGIAGEGAPAAPTAATLVKTGMPVAIIPAADRVDGWTAPPHGHSSFELDRDPRVDFPRLVHLIEDSFRRRLNVKHYIDRVRQRTAGLIVAGEYEGGAIFTWERPPASSTGQRLVPYLDKFAVLQTSQGSSGVADILFQSMVRTCFPNGVCWRSRDNNPVNKWYFERAAGSWKIPGSGWTMFWTGEGVVDDKQRWQDYVGVCKSVVPSWADGKRPD